MSSWKQAVQAQLLFAQKSLSEAQDIEASEPAGLQGRQHLNNAILCARELWACWLNEWGELLTPKQKRERVSSWTQFEQALSGSPSVEQLQEELRTPDSWARGIVELERLSSCDWVDVAKPVTATMSDESGHTAQDSYDALSLVQVDVRPSSVLNGLQDISRMVIELKLFISQVREQHSEW